MEMNVDAEKRAYQKFLAAGMTPEGAAALIGNAEAESDGFVFNRVEYLCLQRLKESGKVYTHESYTAAIDAGKISAEEFLHPLPGKQYGYGIVQWTLPTRKAGLYNLAHRKGVSIADEDMQIEYLLSELETSYPSVLKVLKTTHSIREASDYVLKHFEQPADTGEAVCAGRAARGQKFYEIYAKGEISMAVTANDVIKIMQGWVDLSRAKGTHKPIIDLYNNHKPLARGYKASYSDDYCDITVSAAFIKAGAVNLIGGTECGVEEHINIFKGAGIWKEDGTLTPEPGWIACYNWDDGTQPNDGYADHIGIVESVNKSQKTFVVIEGNMNGGLVGRRTVSIGWGYIRGYAVPKYTASGNIPAAAPAPTPASKGYLEKGDSGEDVKAMQEMLIACGYSCGSAGADGDFGDGTDKAVRAFQKAYGLSVDGKYGPASKTKLEALYKQESHTESTSGSSGGLNETPKWVGKCTGNDVNVRTWAGTEYPNIKSWPKLNAGNLIDVCDSVKDKNGAAWYYVRIDGHIYGFVHSMYICRA